MLNIQDNADAHMVISAMRQQFPPLWAFVTHVTVEQQQQAESAEEDMDEGTDTVSSTMVEPNP